MSWLPSADVGCRLSHRHRAERHDCVNSSRTSKITIRGSGRSRAESSQRGRLPQHVRPLQQAPEHKAQQKVVELQSMPSPRINIGRTIAWHQ